MSFLAEGSPFRALPSDVADELQQTCSRISLPKGGVLIRQGELAYAMYVITRGRVQITKEFPGGESMVITEVGSGDVVGEMGLLIGAPRSATVVALERTDVIEIPKERLAQLIDRYPLVGSALMDVSMERLRWMENVIGGGLRWSV